MPPQRNPFTARQLRPGVIPFIFAGGSHWSRLEERVVAANWRGQIVGPHGTGKSTLFMEWRARLVADGCEVLSLRLQNRGEGRRFTRARELRELGSQLWTFPRRRRNKQMPVVMIDGYEQLAVWQRRLIQGWLRWQRVGLLVTTHHNIGLPTLHTTQTSPRIAREVVQRIVTTVDSEAVAIPAEVIHRLWTAHRGNVRETLFSLYDWYQSSVQLIAAPAKSA